MTDLELGVELFEGEVVQRRRGGLEVTPQAGILCCIEPAQVLKWKLPLLVSTPDSSGIFCLQQGLGQSTTPLLSNNHRHCEKHRHRILGDVWQNRILEL